MISRGNVGSFGHVRALPIPTKPVRRDEAWMTDALCAETDPELFFADQGDGASVVAARAICAKCPVIADCLAYATPRPELIGIWGGTTSRERMTIRGNTKPPRKARPKATHCKRGHERTEDNVCKDGSCRICRLERERAAKQARREAS